MSDNTDNQSSNQIGIEDPGRDKDAPTPLSPEEYAKDQKDARESKPTDGHPEAAKNT